MLHGFAEVELELRSRSGGGYSMSGSFPYGSFAILSDGGRSGRPQKESIEAGAFAYRVEDPAEEIHLLVGHSYDRPLASKLAGTLRLEDTRQALLFEAEISSEMRDVSYVRDAVASLKAGLVGGISPGFRLPPKRAVEKPETIEDEGHDPAAGKHNAIIRRVHEALLYELSLVTRPAYDDTQIQLRNWQPECARVPQTSRVPTSRWRR